MQLAFFLAVLVVDATLGEASWLPRTVQLGNLRRQSGPTGTVPPECKTTCDPPMLTLSTCNPPSPSCVCTKALENGLFDCFTCIGKSVNATDYSIPQGDVDAITSACDQVGIPLPKLTFPGQNSDRPLSTAVASTGNATGTAIVISTQKSGTTQTLSTGPSGAPATPTTLNGPSSQTQSVGPTATAPTAAPINGTTTLPTGGTSASGTGPAATASSGNNAYKAGAGNLMGIVAMSVLFGVVGL